MKQFITCLSICVVLLDLGDDGYLGKNKYELKPDHYTICTALEDYSGEKELNRLLACQNKTTPQIASTPEYLSRLDSSLNPSFVHEVVPPPIPASIIIVLAYIGGSGAIPL